MLSPLKAITFGSWILPAMLFAISDGFILFTDQRWVGEYGWTPEWANAGLYLGCCLLAPLVAFGSNPYLVPGYRKLVARRANAKARLIMSVWLRGLTIGLAGHALVLAVAIVMSTAAGATDSLHWEPFVYALLPIVLFTSLGVLFSSFVPHPFGSAVLLAFTYFVSYNIATGALALPTMIGGQNVTMVGLGYGGEALAVYSALAICSSVVLMAGGILTLVSARGVLVAASFTVCLAVALVGPSLIVHQLPGRLALSNVPIAHRCAGSRPVICVALGHTRNLDVIARRVDRAARPLALAGIRLAGARLIEVDPGQVRGTAGVLELPTSDLNLVDFTARQYGAALTRPTDCAAYYGGIEGSKQSDLLALANQLTDWLVEAPQKQHAALAKARGIYRALKVCDPSAAKAPQ
jgi:hypothetical protein